MKKLNNYYNIEINEKKCAKDFLSYVGLVYKKYQKYIPEREIKLECILDKIKIKHYRQFHIKEFNLTADQALDLQKDATGIAFFETAARMMIRKSGTRFRMLAKFIIETMIPLAKEKQITLYELNVSPFNIAKLMDLIK